MSTPFVGEIRLFGFNFAPRGWALCQGQLIAISTNAALFSLLGTFYGGNGTTNFALPDLRGRRAVGQGQGPGLQDYVMGEVVGTENATLLVSNMPAHNHAMTASFSASGVNPKATLQAPSAGVVLGHSVDVASGGTAHPAICCPAGTTADQALGGLSVTAGNTGGSIPFSILNPLLGLNYSIALQGIFPSRN